MRSSAGKTIFVQLSLGLRIMNGSLFSDDRSERKKMKLFVRPSMTQRRRSP